MTYEQKLQNAHRVIGSALKVAKNPCVMCSFGKDSIVVLHMVFAHRRMKVVFHREPFQHHKYDYANSIIRALDLHIIDYPPSATAWKQGSSEVEIVNLYQVNGKYIYLPTGLRADDVSDTPLCALDEIYGKPTGTFNYPFDMCFHGHKSSDTDPILGAIQLNSDIALNSNGASAVFPIRHLTDDDVWRYIEENNLPVHDTRYEKVDGKWGEREDKTHNPDYISCCYRCMDKEAGSSVYCPKFKANVSSMVPHLREAPKLNLEYLKS